ncbi:MAG: cysteine synthase family protein [Planctomycetes bacterium]|nr:cysteine synthase family protein [Planctomycetota bacterium]MCB9824245.1 cysteine synthase family protein [Planctomycetota bacterium]MCB9828476.1 cysteine synthase family protein [Planctomycetota bacterium]MCB9900243.1 cysteine synthase family protein [Planctomycetota bacterium]
MASTYESIFSSLHALVGNTPLMELRCRIGDDERTVYAKYEVPNFTGSIKDRMALYILEEAWRTGRLAPGGEIVEATSGNTGIAFAALGRALHHPVRIYMPDWMSRERVLLIQSLGATIVPVSKAEGGFLGSIALADAYAEEHPNAFRPQQFDTPANVAAHACGTGEELVQQLAKLGKVADAFVAGVGTGGTVMGVGRRLREANPEVHVHPLEPASSPTLRTGKRVGHHRIQGISDEFVPSILDLSRLDDIVDVHDGDAILMAQRLAAQFGMGLGISSGANLLGALQIARLMGPDAVVATVFPDSNKKYLSTDLCRTEPLKPGYLSPDVELVACCVHPRAA